MFQYDFIRKKCKIPFFCAECSAKKNEFKHVVRTGEKHGRWTIGPLVKVTDSFKRKNGKWESSQFLYECVCECGNKKIVNIKQILAKKSKSCGCLSREQLKLGPKGHHKKAVDSKLTSTWKNHMATSSFPEHWGSLNNFLKEVKPPPNFWTTYFCKIDNEKPFSKTNYIWLSRGAFNKQQREKGGSTK